jgi:hypothetical protein
MSTSALIVFKLFFLRRSNCFFANIFVLNLANVHRHFWGCKIEVRLIIRVHPNIFVVYIRLTLLIGSYFQARVSFRYCKFISL